MQKVPDEELTALHLPDKNPEQTAIRENAIQALPSDLREMFISKSEKFGFDIDFLVAIATWESGLLPTRNSYNPKSNTYDRGLFQINSKCEPEFLWRYWDRTEKFDHYNPEHSIYMACRILSTYRAVLGTEEDAIRAYNLGLVGRQKYPEKADFYILNVQRIRESFRPEKDE